MQQRPAWYGVSKRGSDCHLHCPICAAKWILAVRLHVSTVCFVSATTHKTQQIQSIVQKFYPSGGTHGTAPVGTDETEGAAGEDTNLIYFTQSPPEGGRSRSQFQSCTRRRVVPARQTRHCVFFFWGKTPFAFSTEKENGVLSQPPSETVANLLYPPVTRPA